MNIKEKWNDFIVLLKRDENVKRKIYWNSEQKNEVKLKVDELLIADGPISSGKQSVFIVFMFSS